MIKLVFFVVFFSLIPFAFAQSDNSVVCDESSEENPIIVRTDKKHYDSSDDRIIVSICMMPDVYHKHIQMSIYDSFGIEIERIIDPGLPCPDDCLADEPYFFVQEVPIGSFEKGQQFTVEVHASGIYETTFFEFGEKILHDVCQNVSDENPIAVSTNTRYYEVGDAGTVFGCVSQDAGIKEITITISLGDELALEEKIIPEVDGFFSAEFVIDDKFRIAHWVVKASADEEYSADGFIVSQRADKSFFRTDVVESVIDDQTLLDFTPTDISWDDKKLLLSAFQKLAIIDLENREFHEINIPIDLEEFESIYYEQFSKTTIDEIFFTFQKTLYKINTETDTAEKLIDNVEFFDLTFDDKIIYSILGSDGNENDKTVNIWSADLDGTNAVKILEDEKDMMIFDSSPDGSKLLFTKTSFGEASQNSFVMIYDIETKQTSQVPDLNIYCGPTPKWSPNGQLIVYKYASCDRNFSDASLHITDLDGNNGFLTDIAHSYSDYVISNDGSSVYYYLAPQGVYKMTLAQPIPEFETLAVMILALTIVPILILRKFTNLKLLNY